MDVILYQDGAEVNVPIAAGRTMDDQRARKTIRILAGYQHRCHIFCSEGLHYLKRVVTMVPRMAVLQGAELVSKLISFGNWALSDAVDTIHLVRKQLTNTMPMYCGSVLVIVILDVNDQLITPASLYQWPWELLVEHFSGRLLEAIRVQLIQSISSCYFRGALRLTYCDIAIYFEPVLPQCQ